MSFGRVQLAATGIQDQFLTGEPQVSYFYKKYNRYTNFTTETISSAFDQPVEFGTLVTCNLPRNGELIRTLYLSATIPELTSEFSRENCLNGDTSNIYTNSLGNALIEYAELLIGGQTIERITGEYLQLMNQCTLDSGKQPAMAYLVGDTSVLPQNLYTAKPQPEYRYQYDIYSYNPYLVYGLGLATSAYEDEDQYYHPENFQPYPVYPRTFLIPLSFYFTQSEALAIPLCALDRQDVQVRIKFRQFDKLIAGGLTAHPLSKFQATLAIEYVYLGDDEKMLIKKSSIDYVITQVQRDQCVVSPNVTEIVNWQLKFINPVRELFFLIQDAHAIATNDYFNYYNSQTSDEQLVNLRFQFNGEDIIPRTAGTALYLGQKHFLEHHTRVPNANMRVYNYSFALQPEVYLPTGQVNFSRIKDQTVTINLTPSTDTRYIRVYARSYNILHIQNGLAGLKFISNEYVA
jgi:Major capsid protein N-terminus/Large eukaryotic DNA virus major capsid protein